MAATTKPTLEELSPEILRALPASELPALAAEIRAFLVSSVSTTGGHLGPNLGVVELTLALHRAVESPRSPILFDTGHQAYVHKIVTGRAAAFPALRTEGLSGYPSRVESEHDWVENSHASVSLGWADGLSRGFAASGDPRPVVVVIGDGALTGGVAWEALNSLSGADRSVVVVLNDNGRSYGPTVGGLGRHLGALAQHGGRRALVDLLARDEPADGVAPRPGNLFVALGLEYLGPVDGHDLVALEAAFGDAVSRGRPVVVHCLTVKGKGHADAEAHEADRMHAVEARRARPQAVGRALDVRPAAPAPTWTAAFAEQLVEQARRRPGVVAVTAAMAGPTGLSQLEAALPGRVVDVGIAEQDAVATAAGLAAAGQHPVVALYATFANRAFDQLLLDVGLHGLPVTFVLDRAGITGPDGPSHHGVVDLALFGLVPGLRSAAPRDAATLRDLLDEALGTDGPTMLRFPKGTLEQDLPAVARRDGIDVLRTSAQRDVLVVAVGAMAPVALAAAAVAADAGVGCTVVDPRWVLPVAPGLVSLARRHRAVVTVEDGVREGGVGTHVALALADAGIQTTTTVLGLPPVFVPVGSRDLLLARYGLDTAGLSRTLLDAGRAYAPGRRRGARGDARRRLGLTLLNGGALEGPGEPAGGRRTRWSR